MASSEATQESEAATQTIERHAASRANSSEANRGIGSKKTASLRTLGRFELLGVLGEGAFGRVIRAYDPQLDRLVALKVSTFSPTDTGRVDRFIAEAKSAARLRHPNIVATYECGKVGHRYYIATQFVPGEPLSKHIQQSPTDFRQAVSWVLALARALHYAHGQGVVHRDVKPDNIMIDDRGSPQILDFGLATHAADNSGTTPDGDVLGTPAYMSPEQARGEKEAVGPASDQYSLGVVFYELLTGHQPFRGPPQAVIADVAYKDPLPPRMLNPQVPRDLEAICQQAMRKEVPGRYHDLGHMVDDLRAWLEGLPVQARPIGTVERTRRWCRRNRELTAYLAVAASALLLAAIVSVFFAVSQYRHQFALRTNNEQLQQQKATAVEETSHAHRLTEEALAQKQLADDTARQEQTTLIDAERQEEEAEQASLRATRALKQAQEEAQKAREALQLLEQEIAEREKADQERKIARETENFLESERATTVTRSRFESYSQQLQLAYDAIQSKDHAAAHQALAHCDADMRGWEWDYLTAAAHGQGETAASYPVAGTPVGLQFSDDGLMLAAFSEQARALGRSHWRPAHLVVLDTELGRTSQYFGSAESDPLCIAGGNVMAFSLDKSKLATAKCGIYPRTQPYKDEGRVQEWIIAGTSMVPSGRYQNIDSLRCIWYDSEGTLLGALIADSTLSVCQISDRKLIDRFDFELREEPRNLCQTLFARDTSALLSLGRSSDAGEETFDLNVLTVLGAAKGNQVTCPDGIGFADADSGESTDYGFESGYGRSRRIASFDRKPAIRYAPPHATVRYGDACHVVRFDKDSKPDVIHKINASGYSSMPAYVPRGSRFVFSTSTGLVFVDAASNHMVFELPWPTVHSSSVTTNSRPGYTYETIVSCSKDVRRLAALTLDTLFVFEIE